MTGLESCGIRVPAFVFDRGASIVTVIAAESTSVNPIELFAYRS